MFLQNFIKLISVITVVTEKQKQLSDDACWK